MLTVWIVALYCTEGGRRREKTNHLVLGNNAPERPRVGSSDGLTLEQHCGTTVDEWRVDDIRMANHPADVRRRPVYFTRFDTVDRVHRPVERNEMSAIVTYNALRL